MVIVYADRSHILTCIARVGTRKDGNTLLLFDHYLNLFFSTPPPPPPPPSFPLGRDLSSPAAASAVETRSRGIRGADLLRLFLGSTICRPPFVFLEGNAGRFRFQELRIRLSATCSFSCCGFVLQMGRMHHLRPSFGPRRWAAGLP